MSASIDFTEIHELFKEEFLKRDIPRVLWNWTYFILIFGFCSLFSYLSTQHSAGEYSYRPYVIFSAGILIKILTHFRSYWTLIPIMPKFVQAQTDEFMRATFNDFERELWNEMGTVSSANYTFNRYTGSNKTLRVKFRTNSPYWFVFEENGVVVIETFPEYKDRTNYQRYVWPEKGFTPREHR